MRKTVRIKVPLVRIGRPVLKREPAPVKRPSLLARVLNWFSNGL
jgi:hypothetical protein